MIRYAETGDCRRARLLDYFGEELGEGGCAFCDNCLAEAEPTEQEDVTDAARLFLGCVQRTGQQFGTGHIVDVLRGSRSQAVLRRRHDRLPMYNAGQERAAREWRDLAEQFIRQGLLQQDMEHGGLHLTDIGRRALADEKVFVASKVARPVAAAQAPEYEVALFERLRTLRRELADAADLPPYVVFADSSLVEMAAYLPQSPEGFLAVRGVGQRKLAQYGEPFLKVIRVYCAEHDLKDRPRPQGAMPGSAVPVAGNRSMEVGAAFAAGCPAAELQGRYGVKLATITHHLYRYAVSGHALDPDRVLALSSLSADEQARVLAAIAEHGPERLSPVYNALGGAISYDELHILRLYTLCRRGE